MDISSAPVHVEQTVMPHVFAIIILPGHCKVYIVKLKRIGDLCLKFFEAEVL